MRDLALSACRVEEMHVRYVLSIREDHRRRSPEDAEAAGAGVDRVHGRVGGDKRPSDHAGVPVLRQAHCESFSSSPCHATKHAYLCALSMYFNIIHAPMHRGSSLPGLNRTQ